MELELERFLQQNFGYEAFKLGQKETITSLLEHKDTLAILPTGTGKSLCYQFIGQYLNKPVLIVSPLISLMQDQVEQLRYQGQKATVALNSSLSYSEKRFVLNNLTQFKYIYISPEMLSSNEVLGRLQALDLGLFVVDEAHCISKWGPDFRPDYLNLGRIRHFLGDPLTLALTATATENVAQDIIKELDVKQTELIRYPVDRPNIFLAVEKFTDQAQKDEYLFSIMQKLHGAGIIYFSSKKQAEKIKQQLIAQKISTAVYHADLSLTERFLVQQQFLTGQLDVICATSAFGMGINKADVRYVIHYHMPNDLEDYVQEIGRCSRDGALGVALLLYEPQDLKRQEFIIQKSLPDRQQINYFAKQKALLENFSGEELELLKRLFANGYSATQILELVQIRQKKRTKALFKLLEYIETKECRRQFIATYFKDQAPKHRIKNCCDRDEPFDFSQLKSKNHKILKKESLKTSDYQKILAKLFKDYELK